MYPCQNVVAGNCWLQRDVPNEHWPASIGSPPDSVGEPSTRDAQLDRAMVPNEDRSVVCTGVSDWAEGRAAWIQSVDHS